MTNLSIRADIAAALQAKADQAGQSADDYLLGLLLQNQALPQQHEAAAGPNDDISLSEEHLSQRLAFLHEFDLSHLIDAPLADIAQYIISCVAPQLTYDSLEFISLGPDGASPALLASAGEMPLDQAEREALLVPELLESAVANGWHYLESVTVSGTSAAVPADAHPGRPASALLVCIPSDVNPCLILMLAGQPAPFDRFQIDLLSDVAQVTARELRWYHANHAERTHRMMASRLHSAALELSNHLLIDELLEQLLLQMLQIFPSDAVNVMLVRGGRLRIAAHRGYESLDSTDWLEEMSFSLEGDSPYHWLSDQQTPIIIGELAAPAYVPLRLFTDSRTYLGVPLRHGGQLLGILNLESSREDSFRQEHSQILNAFAGQLVIAIHNAQLYEDLQNSMGEMLILYRAVSVLFSAKSLAELAQQVSEIVGSVIPDVGCNLISRDPHTGKLYWPGVDEIEAPHLDFLNESTLYTSVVRSREILFMPDVAMDPRCGPLEQILMAGSTARMLLPLQTPNGFVGLLDFFTSSASTITDEAQRVLEAFSERVAGALENRLLYEETRRYATDLERRVVERTEELRHTTERVQAILNNSSDAVVLADRNGRIQQTNPAFNRLFGYQPDEIFNQSLEILISPSSQHSTDYMIRLIFSEHIERIEITACRKDGSDLEVDVAISVIDEAYTSGIICSLRDITERRQSEYALKKTRDQLQAILDNTTALIYIKDLDGRYMLLNRAAETLFDMRAEDIIGKSDEFLFNEQAAILQYNDKQVITMQRPMQFEERLSIHDVEHTYISMKVPLLDELGRPYGLCGISTDISRRTRIESELRATTQRFQGLFERNNDAVFIVDLEGFIRAANYRALEILGGHDPDELTGHRMSDFMVWVRHDDMLGINEDRMLSYDQHHIIEKDFVRMDGSGFPAEVNLAMVYDEDTHPLHVQYIVRDISSRKAIEQELRLSLERERELNELKSRFVSMVSHEFRTPLTTIYSSAELLRKYGSRIDAERQHGHLTKILTQVRRLTNLIEDILVMSRAETVGLDFKPESLQVREFCAHFIEELRLVSEPGSQLEFTSSIADTAYMVDENLLQLMLNNLISNALKYSPHMTPVWVSLELANDQLILTVKDEGIGIPDEDQRYLFVNFHRARNVGTIKGTGLGLPIVKMAVEAHHGSIELDSKENIGSVFRVIIPAVLASS